MLDGADKGRRFESDGARAVIGTHESVDFALTDPLVSRFHCELRIDEGRPFVRDLGSRNGTAIDEVPILDAPLAPKAILTLGKTRLRFEVRDEQVELPLADRSRFGRLVGESAASRAMFALLERAAAGDGNVLLFGETGTGKDAAAESIHLESRRRDAPFVVVDCASLSPRLAESELFGHVAGAFTGATADRPGAFESAQGGTLFLDEIGEVPLALQPTLLRAVERHEIKPIGTNQYRQVDVRIVAATNRDLRQAVNAGSFRADLYWRLAVVMVNVPPLRERIDDLPLLVDSLLEELRLGADAGAAALRTRPFRAELARHDWHGNVRELRNYLERCLTLRTAVTIEDGALADTDQPWRHPYREELHSWERRYLQGLLRDARDSVAGAARQASIDRVTLYRMLWKHGLK